MKVIELIHESSLSAVTEQNAWVLVKFSAAWCEPCQLMELIFDKLLTRWVSLQAVNVNVDLQPGLTKAHGVRSVPTFLLLNKGKMVDQLSGLQTEAKINSWLHQHIQPDNK